MGALFDKIAEWLEGVLVDASMDNLKSLFDSVNEQVGKVAGQVGTSPAGFSPSIFSMIRNISEIVIMPIAGIILTFIACYELIQLVTEHKPCGNLCRKQYDDSLRKPDPVRKDRYTVLQAAFLLCGTSVLNI